MCSFIWQDRYQWKMKINFIWAGKNHGGTKGRNWKEKEMWQYMLTIPLPLCSEVFCSSRPVVFKGGFKGPTGAKWPSLRGYGVLSLRELFIAGGFTCVQWNCTSLAVVERIKIWTSIVSKCHYASEEMKTVLWILVCGGHKVKETESELHEYSMSSSIEFRCTVCERIQSRARKFQYFHFFIQHICF